MSSDLIEPFSDAQYEFFTAMIYLLIASLAFVSILYLISSAKQVGGSTANWFANLFAPFKAFKGKAQSTASWWTAKTSGTARTATSPRV